MIDGDFKAIAAIQARTADAIESRPATGFSVALDSATGIGRLVAERAAAMVGRPAAGAGCGCGTMVAAAYRPDQPGLDTAAIMESATPVALQPAAVLPGDLVLRADGEHMGVALSSARYVTVSPAGIVEATWIPWGDVTGVRRPR